MYNPPSIIFDAERMKYSYTGLNSYCYHLGLNLKFELAKYYNELNFYIPKNLKGLFGEDSKYINQNSLHKFYLPINQKNSIWHNTYQNSNYFPSNNKIKIILTIHDLNFLYDNQKNEIKKKKYLKNIQQNINKASEIVCISKSTLKDVEEHLDLQKKSVKIIYNGCSIQYIEELTSPKYLPNKPFLFTIGTITNKKNFHVLPALLQHNDMYLIIAGITQNEYYKNEIIKIADKLGVKSRVIFTGPISENDKQWYYKKCTVFVFPSISEGFGLPVIEAMSFGKPVILSKHTCLPEIGGDEAYYFKSFEIEEMQKNLIDALHDYEVNNRKNTIISRANLFSWKNAANEFIEIYQKIAT